MRKWIVFLGFLGVLSAPAVAEQKAPQTGSPEKLIAAMDSAERSYYLQSFDYAMFSSKPGERHAWKSYNSEGYFELDAPFERNDTICRNFREFISHNKLYSVSSHGVGCKRIGRDGWCKLKKGEMASCAMEPPATGLDAAREAVDDAVRGVQRGKQKTQNAWDNWAPF